MAQLAPPQLAGAPTPEEVVAELDRICSSPAFQGSKRSRQFLEHVCRRTLDGDFASLKERSLAIDVFGRSASSDLSDDTIVRVGAREVRKRLVQYYASPEARSAAVVIDLPAGSYVPEFRAPSAVAPSAPTPASPPDRRWFFLAAGGAVLTAAAAWRWRASAATPFEQFWAPVFAAKDPLIVGISHPIVYHASARAHQMTDERLGPQTTPEQRPIDVAPNQLDATDIIPVRNQYIGFGDMIVTTEIASMLARHGQSMRIRWADSLPFADLRQARTLLVGAVTNRWTIEMSQRWRFQFRRGADRKHSIVDTAGTTEWRATAKDDGSTGDDYILLCRVRDTAAGGLLYVAAGVKQFGTEAAGRVLSDPAQLNAVLEKLPPNWESRNLQVVLQVKVIGNTPGQPAVVATHVW